MLELIYYFHQGNPPFPDPQTTNPTKYGVSQNPGAGAALGNYASNYPRSGAYWTLAASGGEYPGFEATNRDSEKTPPTGKPIEDLSNIYDTVGVESHVTTTTGNVAGDTTIRLNGLDNSGIKFEGFTSDADLCLGNPSQCINVDSTNNLHGLSMSLWVNVPNQLDEDKKYILDTGGDEYGKPGIAIMLRSSIDNRKHSQQVSVLVSTGPLYWKVVLNGMTIAHSWNNVAFRWSDKPGDNNLPWGLQVFVNGSSVAWKRAPYSSGGAESVTVKKEDLKMTLGCRLDGLHCAKGSFDNLAAWYYVMRDSGAVRFDKDNDGEILNFMGGLGFNSNYKVTQVPADRILSTAPGTLQPLGWEPWQYTWEKNLKTIQSQRDESFLDDTSFASEGDCEAQNPSTWSELGHPVDCADTIKELQNAIAYSDDYKGYSMVKAMVKIINKNILSQSDFEYLKTDPFVRAKAKLDLENNLDYTTGAKYYSWFGYFVSQMEHKMYASDLRNAMSNQEAGISYWTAALDSLLTSVSKVMTLDSAVLIEANNTVSAIMKTTKAQITAGVHFPDYSLMTPSVDDESESEPYYSFPEKKKEHWGRVTDWIQLPVGAFDGWKDLATEIKVIVKLYNQLHLSWPAFLDSRVTGDGVASSNFFLNSRVISLTVDPPMDNTSVLDPYPVKYLLQHITPQPDLPFKKGAILCVHWAYNAADNSKVGAWDTGACKLVSTNDTHSTCQCSHMSDFAILQEDHKPNGAVGDGAYIFCYVLYGISLICLLVFVTIILINDRLHYELHIITMNVALAMIFAIVFYLCHLSAYTSRLPCLFVSVFMHYSYTAAYLWCVLLAHYIFRALTSGHLGGIIKYYCLGGWGLPALLVAILAGIDVTRYGIGERCLGAQTDYFLWVYIGFFIFFCIAVCPLLLIALINWNKDTVRDPEDKMDIKMTMIGCVVYWPIIMLTWIMAIFIYLEPQDSQIPDFLFEFFNSLQGIFIFLLLGVLIPSFRNILCFCSRRKHEDLAPLPDDTELYAETDADAPPQPVESRPGTGVTPAGMSEKKKKKKSKKNKDDEMNEENGGVE